MKLQFLLATPILSLLSFSLSAQWLEDFETDGEGIRYTSSNTFNSGINDHFGRTDGTDITGSYTDAFGSFYWAGEDLDDNAGDVEPFKRLTFNTIDVTGETEVTFTGLFATGNPNFGWDEKDSLRVEYSFDAGSTWQTLLLFGSNAAGSNHGLYHDPTPGNGDFAEGVQLTQSFLAFSATIITIGNNLELRVYARANAADEEFAFDSFSVVGGAGIAGCNNPSADNYNPTATSDDGSCIFTGCTDSLAINYDSQANNDDGSCFFTLPNIVINEIHFNPCVDQGEDFEWEFVELYNAEASEVDLSGFTFTTGIDFTFPVTSTLASGEFIIICATAANYEGNGYQVFQWNAGALSSNGELVQLQDVQGFVIDEVDYLDVLPWPDSPHCQCSSLELVDPLSDNALAANWQVSYVEYGTPGGLNSTPPIGCTNPDAANYDPEAMIDDGSCVVEGCTDIVAVNYSLDATQDDGSCIYPGCTYDLANNYDPLANDDNGTCEFNGDGACEADITGDGLINTADLVALLGVFGGVCL